MPVRRRTSKRKPTIPQIVDLVMSDTPLSDIPYTPENRKAVIGLYFFSDPIELPRDYWARAGELLDIWPNE